MHDDDLEHSLIQEKIDLHMFFFSFLCPAIYSRNSLSKIKDRAYIINLDEYESIGTHWITLYVNAENLIRFDSFAVEHIPKEI